MITKAKISTDKGSLYLKEKGIHPSYHRIKILEYLLKNKTHPTVDMIYRDLLKEIPTLSKTTIYNTMKIFLQNGIVSELTIEENEIRFESDLKPHAHFKCVQCKQVYDIDQKFNVIDKNILEGHKINELHIYFKGICRYCTNK